MASYANQSISISSVVKEFVCTIEKTVHKVRVAIFRPDSYQIVCMHEIELPILSPQEGWIEQDPKLIVSSVNQCINATISKFNTKGEQEQYVVGVGITNERDTFLIWDRRTGEPLTNAILSMDKRATTTVEMLLASIPVDQRSINFLKDRCGLPISSLFCAVKLRWLRDNVTAVREAMENGTARFGTIDTWLIYNLTGGATYTGSHKTDVTNASRTMLMNLRTQSWDPRLLAFFGLPKDMLPEICMCSDIYGVIMFGRLRGSRISGCIADHQASLVSLRCLRAGEVAVNYASSCTLIYNTGMKSVFSEHELLTTICYQLSYESSVHYGLEGEVAKAGDVLKWLRDQMGIISSIGEVESMASKVPNSGGVYFVPALDGILAPHWSPTACGLICGISDSTTNEHIVHATLEALCFQVSDILDAMALDSKVPLNNISATGAMTSNQFFMQLQANLTGLNILVAKNCMNSAMGTAIIALDYSNSSLDFFNPGICSPAYAFRPRISKKERKERHFIWKEAVESSLSWNNQDNSSTTTELNEQ